MNTRSSWRLRAGDTLVPGLVVQRNLGAGARYEVFLVTDDRRACAAVAKVLRPEMVNDQRAMRALAREARCVRTHAHPNIVRGYGETLDGDRPHVLLEYLEGPTLRALVKRYGQLSVEQLVPLGVCVGAALHFLHTTGWVHLDVKSSNVIMGPSATLIDLSVARPIAVASRIRGRVGTTATMAPEQLDPDARGPVGPAADVWGLGLVLRRALGDKVDRVPPALTTIIEGCLEPDQTSRPTIAEVLFGLEPMLSDLPARPTLGRKRPRLVAR